MARRAARVDGNQAAIVQGLRAIGARAFSAAPLGRGFPDIVCGFHGRNYLFECKDPAQVPSKRRLTDDEAQFHSTWRGQVAVIETLDEAISILKADEGKGGVLVKQGGVVVAPEQKVRLVVEMADG